MDNKNLGQSQEVVDQVTVETFLNDEETKKNYENISQQLQQIFGEQWFTVDLIAKKTAQKDKAQIGAMMTGLQLFNMVRSKQGGQLYKNQLKFQLTLTPESRLKVLYEEREKTETQLELINKEIKKVESEI